MVTQRQKKQKSDSLDSEESELEKFVEYLAASLERSSILIVFLGFLLVLSSLTGVFFALIFFRNTLGFTLAEPFEAFMAQSGIFTIVFSTTSLCLQLIRDSILRRGGIKYEVLVEEYENVLKRDVSKNFQELKRARVKIAIRSFDRALHLPFVAGAWGSFFYFILNLVSLAIVLTGDVNFLLAPERLS